MLKQKLLKQFLPMLLSVAMILGEVPMTALAAEDTQQIVATEEAAVDETAAEDEQQAVAVEEVTTTEAATEDAQTEAVVEETATAAEGAAVEAVAEDAGISAASDEIAVFDAAEAVKPVIVVDHIAYGESLSYEYKYTNDTVTAPYVWQKAHENGTAYAADAMIDAAKDSITTQIGLKPVEVKGNEYARKQIDTDDDGTPDTWMNVLVATDTLLEFTWQAKGADGTYTALAAGTKPVDAGEYRLVVTRREDPVHNALAIEAADAVKVADLVIEKAPLTLSAPNVFYNTTRGVTAKDVKDLNGHAYIDLRRSGEQIDLSQFLKDGTTLSVKVMEAYEKKELADTDLLKKGGSYYLQFVLELSEADAKNYEVKAEDLVFPIYLVDTMKRNAQIAITYTDESKLSPYYTGSAIDISTAYTAKVMLADTRVQLVDGTWKELPGSEELAGAELKKVWCDAEKVAYEDEAFVPKDAGVYFYRLSLEDENYTIVDENGSTVGSTYKTKDGDTYQCVYIRVEIKMIGIAIEPQIAENPKFQADMKVEEALKQVTDYKVYQVSGGDAAKNGAELTDIDKNTFWGIFSGAKEHESSQTFQPWFAIQQGVEKKISATETKVEWTPGTMASGSKLKKGFIDPQSGEFVKYRYRIVFSGEKAVYLADGSRLAPGGNYDTDINAGQSNYTVDLTNDIIEKYAKEIALSTDELAIKIDKLAGEKAGTLADPIIKKYDGEPIYKSKGEYKVAEVVVSSGDAKVPDNAASMLTYQWQYAYGKGPAVAQEYDTNGDPIYPETYFGWVNVNWTDTGKQISPKDAGLYRLKITFLDPKGENYAEETYVYYVIQPQDVLVQLEGAPVFYNDNGYTTPYKILQKLQNKDATAAATYLNVKFYAVDEVTKDPATGAVTVKKGAELNLENEIMEHPTTYLRVEKQIAAGEEKGKWVACDDDEIFERGTDTKYRISVKPGSFGNYSPLENSRRSDIVLDIEGIDSGYLRGDGTNTYDGTDDWEDYKNQYYYRGYVAGCWSNPNYNFGHKLNVYNIVAAKEDQEYFYGEGAVALTLKDSLAIPLQVKIDEDQITGNVKIYDGKPFDISKVKELVKILDQNGDDVTAALKDKLTYNFVRADEDYGVPSNGSVRLNVWNHGRVNSYLFPIETAIHGGDYYLVINMDTDDTYKGFDVGLETTFTIKQKELTVRPVLKTGIKAGTDATKYEDIIEGFYRAYDLDTKLLQSSKSSYTLEGLLEDDADKDILSLIPAGAFGVYEDTEARTTASGLLKSKQEYYVKINRLSVSFKEFNDPAFYYTDYLDEEKFANDKYYQVVGTLSYGIDYTLADAPELVAFTPEAVAAKVERTRYAKNAELTITSEAKDAGFSHTIKVMSGMSVPFNKSAAGKDGNYIWVNIYAPVEFQGKLPGPSEGTDITADFKKLKFIFEDAIENAGGKIVGYGPPSADPNYLPYITVEFDASKKETATFEIIWDIANDYRESYTVDLAKANLQADYSKAVLPKKLKFASSKTTMYVGDAVQLDARITKKNKNDIILLGYDLADAKSASIVAVNDSGFVTALAKGTAKVIAYPCYLDENGVKTRIEKNEKGKTVKPATITIQVKEVAKPTGLKATPTDIAVQIQYKKPANGFRREVYILEGKKKEKDFKSAIDSVQNGNYKDVFVNTVFVTETVDEKNTKLVTLDVRAFENKGLKPNTQYTVYVRNVSGMRALDDGSQIAASSAGVVKTFKTKKSRVTSMKVYFDQSAKKQTAKYYEWYNEDVQSVYVAKITDKSAKVSVDAEFRAQDSQADADAGDHITRTLPLKKADTAKYEAPKLSYYAIDTTKTQNNVKKDPKAVLFVPNADQNTYDADGTRIPAGTGTGGSVNNTNKVYDNQGNVIGTNYYASSVAKVSKSGVVSFKGKGLVRIMVRDKNTGRGGNFVDLYIDATEDKMKAKKSSISLQTGRDGFYLSEYLEYYQGSKKLSAPSTGELTVTPDTSNYFKMEKHGNDYFITAIKPGGNTKITVKNSNVKKDVKITLKSPAIAQVKSLKKADVYWSGTDAYAGVQHDNFSVTFTYPTKYYDFRFEVKDAKGNIIKNEIVNGTSLDPQYDSKKKVFIFTKTFSADTTNGVKNIDRQMKYTVKVDAVCVNEDGEVFAPKKSATTKVTTTNIAASYVALAKKLYHNKVNATTGIYINPAKLERHGATDPELGTHVAPYYGGDTISVQYTRDIAWGTTRQDLNANPNTPTVLKVGNTYTLAHEPDSTIVGAEELKKIVRDRKTDTLTWKSKNAKVAKVKALNSYSASLKALKPGETEIQVTSKVTKKVIARYRVIVTATGDADDYYGDYEPYAAQKWTTANAREVLKLTVNDPMTINLSATEAQWFVFTTPAFGKYYFGGYTVVDDMKNIGPNGVPVTGAKTYETDFYEKGKKFYIYYTPTGTTTVTIRGDLYQDITLGDNKVKGGQNMHFVAPEDNTYTIAVIKDGKVDKKTTVNWSTGSTTISLTISLKKNEYALATAPAATGKQDEYIIRVTKIEPVVLTLDTAKDVKLTVDEDVNWYVFTAEEDALYDFTVAGATKDVNVQVYNDIAGGVTTAAIGAATTVSVNDITNVTDRTYVYSVEKGKKRYVKISAANSADITEKEPITATIKVSKTAIEATAMTEGGEGTATALAETGQKWYTFTATKKARYKAVITEDNGTVEYYYVKENGSYSRLNNKDELDLDEGETIKILVKVTYVGSATGTDGKQKPATGTLLITSRNLAADLPEATEQNVGTLVAGTADNGGKDFYELKAGRDVWYKFKASAYNIYNIELKGATDSNTEINCYRNLQANSPDTSNYTYTKSGTTRTISNYELEANKTIYVCVTAGATEKDMKLIVTKRTVTDLPDASTGDVTLTGKDLYYVYTVPEADYYTVYASADKAATVTTATNFKMSGSTTSSLAAPAPEKTTDQVVRTEALYKAGDKIYFEVGSSVDSETNAVNVKLQVRRRGAAAALADGTKAELKKFDQKWYKFTADTADVYTITVTSDKNVNVSFYEDLKSATSSAPYKCIPYGNDYAYTYTPAAPSTDPAVSYPAVYSIMIPESGTKVFYVKLDTMEDAATATVNIKKSAELKDGTAIASGDLETGKAEKSALWYYFKAPKAGYYSFTAEAVKAGTIRFNYYYGKSMEAADTGVLSVPGTNKPADPTAADPGTTDSLWNLYLDQDEVIYVSAKSTESGTDRTKPTGTIKIAALEAVALDITGKEEVEKTDTFSKNGRYLYAFTADVEGWYAFYATAKDTDSDPAKAMDSRASVSVTSPSKEEYANLHTRRDDTDIEEAYIMKNKKVFLDVKASSIVDGKNTETFTIKVKKVALTAKDKPLTMDVSGNDITLTNKEAVWYEFPVDQTNKYTFVVKPDKGSVDVQYTVAKSISDASRANDHSEYTADSNNSCTNIIDMNSFASKDKIFVRLSTNSIGQPDTSDGAAADAKITAVKANVKITKRNLDTTKVLRTSSPVEINLAKKDDEVWYKFISDDPNTYTIYSEDVAEDTAIKVELYKEITDGDYISEYSVTSSEKTLTMANCNMGNKEEYYVRVVKTSSDDTKPAKATLKVRKRATSTLAANGSDSISLAKSGDDKWYVFTADSEDPIQYTFYTDNVTDGVLRLETAASITDPYPRVVAYSDSKGNLAYTTDTMSKKQKLYIRVVAQNVTKDKTLSATLKVKYGEATPVALPADGVQVRYNDIVYTYTPAEKGEYAFVLSEISNNASLTVKYEDENGDIKSDVYRSYVASGVDAWRKTFEANKPIKIYVSADNNANTSTLKVKALKPDGILTVGADALTVSGLTKLENDDNYYDYKYYAFQPAEAGSYKFTVTNTTPLADDNSNAWDCVCWNLRRDNLANTNSWNGTLNPGDNRATTISVSETQVTNEQIIYIGVWTTFVSDNTTASATLKVEKNP